uniref:Uncharacterized protein n=1 Tax=Caenorhabditis japonica TaxID=281687 RepID=A0A8R1IB22_CAEJA
MKKSCRDWEKLTVDYQPKTWISFLRDQYSEIYQESIERLQKIEDISAADADRKLMEILQKNSLIERNLSINGAQTAEELFANLEEACQENPNPFTSVTQLSDYCDSMSPLFIFTKLTKQFRNSGYGFRCFVQYIRERLALGDIVNEDTIDEIMKHFMDQLTFPGDDKYHEFPNYVIFKRREFLLDFISLRVLAMTVPGFHYDATKKRLHLTSEGDSRLILQIPILVYTVDTDHEQRIDISRKVTGKVKVYNTRPHMDMMEGMMIDHSAISGAIVFISGRSIQAANKEEDEEKSNTFIETHPHSLYYIEGNIRPGCMLRNQVEAFRIATVRNLFNGTFSSPLTAVARIGTEVKTNPTFLDKAEEIENMRNNELAMERPPRSEYFD